MIRIIPVRWSLACFAGLVLGVITSVVPFLLWRKVALSQGHEFVVDILIILCLLIGSGLFTRSSVGLISASIELFIIVFLSSVITAFAVLVMDRYGYESITVETILNGLPASLVFALPSFLLVFIWLLFKYGSHKKSGPGVTP